MSDRDLVDVDDDAIAAKLFEMVSDKADEKSTFGDNFSTEWAGNDKNNSLLNCARLVFQTRYDSQASKDLALESFYDAVIAASGITFSDAEDALIAEVGYEKRVDVDDYEFVPRGVI